MILCFRITMPNVGSWNGKWSGESNYYAKTRTFQSKKAKIKANEIVENNPYHYRWEDGWSAMITVWEVDSKESAKIRKKSNGFIGYDWMIESIIEDGIIKSNYERAFDK